MRNLMISIRMFLAMTLLTGLAYPLVVTALAQSAWPAKAGGSLLSGPQGVLGSSLISQKFTGMNYFWPRPSACDYNASNSGGSNYGPCSAALKKSVDERRAVLALANPGQAEIPEDLLFASASGLDPHISPEAARYQVQRVAKARRLDAGKIRALVEAAVEPPQFGFLGEARVNVLELNLALDALK